MGYFKKNKPNGYWNLETIKNELKPFIKKFNGIPNSGYFKRENRSDLGTAIYKYGGYEKLSKELNLPIIQTVVRQKNCSKPIGYWQKWENFKKELEPLIKEYGTVPPQSVIRKIDYSLEHAFTYYGGFKKVREKMNLPKLYENNKTQPYGYWGNIENLKKALSPIIKEYGNVPSSIIIKSKYGYGLHAAIERHYGGYLKLRKKLGLPERFYSKENTRISVYREIGLRAHGHFCHICCFSAEVEVHHIDEDRFNNNESNLMVLCRNHHRMIHTGKIKNIIEYKKNYKENREKEYERK